MIIESEILPKDNYRKNNCRDRPPVAVNLPVRKQIAQRESGITRIEKWVFVEFAQLLVFVL